MAKGRDVIYQKILAHSGSVGPAERLANNRELAPGETAIGRATG
jgi:hypothetical protein